MAEIEGIEWDNRVQEQLDSDSEFEMEIDPSTHDVNDSANDMEIGEEGEMNPQSPIGLTISIQEGMEFESLDKVRETYSNFARCRGFGLRKRSSKPGYCVFVCLNEGKHRPKQTSGDKETMSKEIIKRRTSTARTGFRASLHVLKHKWKNVWVVSKFNNEHNHKLVTPQSVPLIRCHRELPEIARCLTEKFLDAGVPTSKVVNMVDEGVPFFDKRDCWNHAKRLRLQNLDVGDAQQVYDYCRKKKEEDNEFFYSIQCDDEARMVNFFWVDGRSRKYYSVFDDAVTFDTTYKTNKYSMPFAPFTGINHHMRSILYGCALLQDESKLTFTWLFEAWLEAMSGKMPISIITDQDHVIANAISKVFPDMKHRLCIWHIMRKFPEKLASVYHKRSTFKKGLKQCIRSLYSIDGFENDWMQLMTDHNLDDNEWLKGLFDIRGKWVPIFNQDVFWGGMNTTQRSESMNSFFDHFVNVRTTLHEFVNKFDGALQTMYAREKKEDYETRHKNRVLHLQSPLEEHAAEVYTTRVFGKVFEELEKINKFKKEKISKVDNLSTYVVTFIDNLHDKATVQFDSMSLTVDCSCKLWCHMGILCRHIFAIFQKKDVHKIPDQYVLPRWTKDANLGIDMINIHKRAPTGDMLMTLTLQKRFGMLLDAAKTSNEAYNYIIEGLEKLHVAVMSMYPNPIEGDVFIDLGNLDTCDGSQTSGKVQNMKDPYVSNTKGRKKDSDRQTSRGRFKSGLEIALNRSRVCKGCGQRGHNIRTCKSITTSQS